MKEAIEYVNDLVCDKTRTYKEIVKQIQIDAIQHTVKVCADEVELEMASDYGHYDRNNAKFQYIPDTEYITEHYGHGDVGYTAIRTNKQSILSVADKLIKDIK